MFSSGSRRAVERHGSAVEGSAVFGNKLFDWSKCFFEIQKMTQIAERLASKCDERKQFLESLQLRKAELLREVTCAHEQHLILKTQKTGQILNKGEKKLKEEIHLDSERQRLTKNLMLLQQKKSELEPRLKSHGVFHEFMERVVKLSQFDKVLELVEHLESLLNFRDQLFQRDRDAQDQIKKLRTELATQADQTRLLMVQRRNQLTHLQTELERTRSGAFHWEQKWNHIEVTAAKKTLLLGKIKMAILNLYEMTGNSLDREEKDVDVNDTDTQLKRMQEFFLDHKDIMKQCRSAEEKNIRQRE